MPCPKNPEIRWIDKVNFIRHYAVNSCSTTLQVYVETGIHADLNLVLGLAGISPTEGVYTMLRPKGARSIRHGGSKGSKGKAIGKQSRLGKITRYGEDAIPDSAELVSETVHLITGLEKPVYSNLGTHLFEIAKPIIAGAYYITMVNAATDFAFDWYSGILLNPASKCDIGRFSNVNFYNNPPNLARHNVDLGFEIFPPVGSNKGPDGMRVFSGSWCVTITIDISRLTHNDTEVNINGGLMLGVLDPVQCGPNFSVDLASYEAEKQVKIVRRVKGDDTINLNLGWHLTNQPLNGILIGWSLEGFMI